MPPRLTHRHNRPSAAYRQSCCILLLTLAASASPALATGRTWLGTSDVWSNAAEWSGGIVPDSGDAAYILPADAINRTVTIDQSASIGVLHLGNTGAGLTTFSQSDYAFTVSTEDVGYSGTAAVIQSGGTHTASAFLELGYNKNATGSYSLSNTAQLFANTYEFIGDSGSGNFTQTGGTNTVGSALILANSAGSSGTYNFSAGSLVVSVNETIGGYGNATFTQSSGTHSVNTGFNLAAQSTSNATYNLSGDASLTVLQGFSYIGSSGNATFNQTGGTFTATAPGTKLGLTQYGGAGTYNLSAGTASFANVDVGIGGAGILNISGTGALTCLTAMSVDNEISHITLNGGSLATDTLTLTYGSCAINAGTFSANTVTIAAATTTSSSNFHIDSAATITTFYLNAGSISGHGSISGNVLAGSTRQTLIAPSLGLPATVTGNLSLGSLSTTGFTTFAFNLVDTTHYDSLTITSTGGLTLYSANVQLTDNNAPQGYYKLIQYAGTIKGVGPSSLHITTPAPTNMAYLLDLTHDPGFIDLHKVLLGDINGDNIVDGTDFDTWFTHLQSANPTYATGDLNGDGHVDGADFDLWFTHLENSFGGGFTDSQLAELSGFLSPAQLASLTPIPEPTSLSLLALATLPLLRRRRQQS